MSDAITISVIIIAHNVAELLANCLDSVFAECAGLATEVFVVDSASTDNTVDLVREKYPQVHLRAFDANIGFSAGNNAALPHCRGRYILLLNPDTVVHPGSIRGLVRYLEEHPRVGAAGPTLRLGDNTIQPECARHQPRLTNLLQWLLLLDKIEFQLRFRGRPVEYSHHPPRGTLCDRWNLLSWKRDRPCEVESIAGACMAIRKEVVEQLGLLDETSPFYLDDIDYCRRIRQAGWQIHYVAGATVTHLWQQSSAKLQRKGKFYAMVCHSIRLYLRKHDGLAAAMAFSAMAAFASVVRLCIAAVGAVLMPAKRHREYCRYQAHMSFELARWAFRIPKAPPRLGFAAPSSSLGARNAPEGADTP